MRSSALLVSALLPLVLPVVVAAEPEPGGPVIVIVAPWLRSGEAIDLVVHAGGLIVRGTALPWIAIARSDDATFAMRLRRAGAWATVNAAGIGGCRPDTPVASPAPFPA